MSADTDHIMLIDDDPIANLINKELVKRVNPETRISGFEFAPEALEYLGKELARQEVPQKIFLDINMPVMSGWEFLEQFEALEIPSEVYILSSSVNHMDIQKSKAYKTVKEYIVKPLDPNKLEAIIGS